MPNLCYILSASHSGSTLLAMLLGAQQGVCAVGELKATSLGDPEEYRCSCGTLIRRCGFWRQVSAALEKRGISGFDITDARTSIHDARTKTACRLLRPLLRGPIFETGRDAALALTPGWASHLQETQRRNVGLICSLQQVTNAQWVIDSSKQALRLKYLLQIPDLHIKVIRLIRDGQAVSLTYTDEWNFADAKDPVLRGGGNGQRRSPVRASISDAANEWKRSNEAADCLVARLGTSQWVEVKYEDLCTDPEGTLRHLCAFLDLPSDNLRLDFKDTDHHVIGNGMRFDRSSEIQVDERWRQHLCAEDLRAFERVAGKLNRKYGYV